MRLLPALALLAASAAQATGPSGHFIDPKAVDTYGQQIQMYMSPDCTFGVSSTCYLIFNGPGVSVPDYNIMEVIVWETNGWNDTQTTQHPLYTGDPQEPIGTAVYPCMTACDTGGRDPGRMKMASTSSTSYGSFTFNEDSATDELLGDSVKYWIGPNRFDMKRDTIYFNFSQSRLGKVHVQVLYDFQIWDPALSQWEWACGMFGCSADFWTKVHP